MHIANGMYGLILVEPKEGLPKVDREYYVMQGDFYTSGPTARPGLQPFDMEKALREDPDYVVFNGSVGALTGDKAAHRQGRRDGAALRRQRRPEPGHRRASTSSARSSTSCTPRAAGGSRTTNVQTTLVPAGGSTIVDFKVEVPGTFILVDHSIFRTFNKGALGMLNSTSSDTPSRTTSFWRS
jgi:nitrite reductase (NO-forming)